jgi:hypothetical protein
MILMRRTIVKKNKMAQELTYLICKYAEIDHGDENFPHAVIGVRRKNALKILDGLVALGMIQPTSKIVDCEFEGMVGDIVSTDDFLPEVEPCWEPEDE